MVRTAGELALIVNHMGSINDGGNDSDRDECDNDGSHQLLVFSICQISAECSTCILTFIPHAKILCITVIIL